MPRGMYRSHHFRKVFVKTPGGRTALQYRERKPQRAHCRLCQAILAGVPRERPAVMRHISKSSKRPSRPYGGNLCSACLRTALQAKARGAA